MSSETRIAYRTCPLCEAGCGLEIALHRTNGPERASAMQRARPERPGRRPRAGNNERVGRIRGDRDDVFSHGFICPKGSTLRQLHEDPDWLRGPLVKRDGRFEPASWDEAFGEVERRLLPIVERHGRDAVGIYLGNPNAHSLAALIFLRPLIRALGTTNVFSASTVDQRPKEVSAGLMFGGALTVPVPDVDRTDFLLMLGANPYASNGSLATAPDWPGRIEALLDRGGRLVVVDPRRTQTAEVASRHLAIRPGTDPFLLMALVNVLAGDRLIGLDRLEPYVTGVDEVVRLAGAFTPEAVAPATGLVPEEIRGLAHDLAAAPSACVYGRIGTTTAEFGTLTSWLVDVLNVLTGNLDRPGGAMFATAAAGAANTRGTPRYGRGLKLHRRRSRVRGLGETMGELPTACLAEEIDTPGEGQIRAMLTVGGNPVLSTPNAGRLDAALARLEFMVAVDPYVNETTRHADVILPVPTSLQRPHYDLALLQLAVRNVANYSPAVLPLDEGQPDEWHVLARLALVLQGFGADADPALVDDLVLRTLVEVWSRAPLPTRPAPWPGARSTRSSRCWASGRAHRASSTSCCAPARTARASVPTPVGSASTCYWTIRMVSTSVRSSRASRTCCARPRAWWSSRPKRWWRTSTACGRPWPGRPVACGSSVAVTCGPTTPGCTTWRCW